jgi:hypothetical protein
MHVSYWLIFSFCYSILLVSGIGPASVRLHPTQTDGFRFDACDTEVDASSVYRDTG